ncbi:hypothetical protein DTO271G3_6388 [Paecilomyces variotii]|nr:hypothetical protein DTO271G3_6388 [Paecilomyces variotii]
MHPGQQDFEDTDYDDEQPTVTLRELMLESSDSDYMVSDLSPPTHVPTTTSPTSLGAYEHHHVDSMDLQWGRASTNLAEYIHSDESQPCRSMERRTGAIANKCNMSFVGILRQWYTAHLCGYVATSRVVGAAKNNVNGTAAATNCCKDTRKCKYPTLKARRTLPLYRMQRRTTIFSQERNTASPNS